MWRSAANAIGSILPTWTRPFLRSTGSPEDHLPPFELPPGYKWKRGNREEWIVVKCDSKKQDSQSPKDENQQRKRETTAKERDTSKKFVEKDIAIPKKQRNREDPHGSSFIQNSHKTTKKSNKTDIVQSSKIKRQRSPSSERTDEVRGRTRTRMKTSHRPSFTNSSPDNTRNRRFVGAKGDRSVASSKNSDRSSSQDSQSTSDESKETDAKETLSRGTVFIPKGVDDWDGWPDGEWAEEFSYDVYDGTNQFQVGWSMCPDGGNRRGDPDASDPQDGRKHTRRCQGIIKCTNPNRNSSKGCKMLIRPTATKNLQRSQLARMCRCGYSLHHTTCKVTLVVIKWLGGVVLQSTGAHMHERPSHTLHVTRTGASKFEELVLANPSRGPLALAVGSAKSAPAHTISSVYYNPDRIARDRKAILKKHDLLPDNTDHSFLDQFAEFDRSHPHLVVAQAIGEVAVITLQSDFMREQMYNDNIEKKESAVSGVQTDGAHKYFKDKNSILITTSTYSPVLESWVPVIFSYSNGASWRHYYVHFDAFIRAVAKECRSRGDVFSDEKLAMVVDFSQAQKQGFRAAFADYFLEIDPKGRTKQQLENDAEKLLKGCAYHFEDSARRISKIASAVPPSRSQEFLGLVTSLLLEKDLKNFGTTIDTIIQEFSDAVGWLEWWQRPSNAKMIFPLFRDMEEAVWESLPKTTNAEEAMHFRFYRSVGKGHSTMSGLKGLAEIAEYFQSMTEAAQGAFFLEEIDLQSSSIYAELSVGTPIRWRRQKAWVVLQERYGSTHPSRKRSRSQSKKGSKNPRSKSRGSLREGRPPDTAHELDKVKKRKDRSQSKARPSPKKGILKPTKAPPENNGSELLTVPETTKENTAHFKDKGNQSDDEIEFLHIVPQDIQCTPWENNSCWLDACLEGIFWTLRDDLNASILPKVLRVADRGALPWLRHYLLERAGWDGKEFGDKPNRNLAKKLAEKRNELRSLLSELEIVQGTGFHSAIEWLDISVQDAGELMGMASVFRGSCIKTTQCRNGAGATEHVHLQPSPFIRFRQDIRAEDYKIHGGDINSFINDHVGGGRRVVKCGRNHDGPLSCGNAAFRLSPWITIPQILLFQIQRPYKGKGPQWEFPPLIQIQDYQSDHNLPFSYHLKAAILFSKKYDHYRTLFIASNSVYLYDGRVNSGKAMKEAVPNMTAALKEEYLGENWVIEGVFYQLKGGMKEQSRFETLASTRILEKHQVCIMSDDKYPMKRAHMDQSQFQVKPRQAEESDRSGWVEYWRKENTAETSDPEEEDSMKTALASPATSNNANMDDFTSPVDNIKENSDAENSDTSSSSAFDIDCRCGVRGPGPGPRKEPVIECCMCHNYSHISCLRGGGGIYREGSYEEFTCPKCAGTLRIPKWWPPEVREEKCLEASRAALGRVGQYYYPCRLIQKIRFNEGEHGWEIEWWRGNKYATGRKPTIYILDEDLEDGCFGSVERRRKIRLGVWDLATTKRPWDLHGICLGEHHSITPDVDAALLPHAAELKRLLSDIIDGSHAKCNAPICHRLLKLQALHPTRNRTGIELEWTSPSGSLFPYVGKLTWDTIGAIGAWYRKNLRPNERSMVATARTDMNFLMGPARGHALTIVTLSQMRDEWAAQDVTLTEDELMEKAFNYLCEVRCDDKARSDDWRVQEVNWEAVYDLERVMFSRCKDGGPACEPGIWGLDIGPHQDGWNPNNATKEVPSDGDGFYLDDAALHRLLKPGPEYKGGNLKRPRSNDSEEIKPANKRASRRKKEIP